MKRRVAAGLAVIVIAVSGAGAASACDRGGNGARAEASAFMGRHHDGHALFRVAGSYLGLTKDQLKAKLRAGQTLAQIADATPGKSSAGLVDTLTAAVKTKLDRWVDAGKLTAAQESTILQKVHDKLARLVTVSWAGRLEHH